jgi:hypothetical protein
LMKQKMNKKRKRKDEKRSVNDGFPGNPNQRQGDKFPLWVAVITILSVRGTEGRGREP